MLALSRLSGHNFYQLSWNGGLNVRLFEMSSTSRNKVPVEPLDAGNPLPRDVPLSQLRKLPAEVESAAENQANRQALLDRAWLLLMLHSGLRTAEIRRLGLADLDVEKRQLRIEPGKGQQERIVFLSEESIAALQAYLAVRGPALTGHVFIFRHRPMSAGYCGQRLRAIGRQCGLHVTPHRLRHSCATLLLNAGAPVLTVQRVLGHRYVQTTLRYAWLYEATVVKDYRRATGMVEGEEYNKDGFQPDCSDDMMASRPAINGGKSSAMICHKMSKSTASYP